MSYQLNAKHRLNISKQTAISQHVHSIRLLWRPNKVGLGSTPGIVTLKQALILSGIKSKEICQPGQSEHDTRQVPCSLLNQLGQTLCDQWLNRPKWFPYRLENSFRKTFEILVVRTRKEKSSRHFCMKRHLLGELRTLTQSKYHDPN